MPVLFGLGPKVRFENPPKPPFAKGGQGGTLPKGEGAQALRRVLPFEKGRQRGFWYATAKYAVQGRAVVPPAPYRGMAEAAPLGRGFFTPFPNETAYVLGGAKGVPR